MVRVQADGGELHTLYKWWVGKVVGWVDGLWMTRLIERASPFFFSPATAAAAEAKQSTSWDDGQRVIHPSPSDYLVVSCSSRAKLLAYVHTVTCLSHRGVPSHPTHAMACYLAGSPAFHLTERPSFLRFS